MTLIKKMTLIYINYLITFAKKQKQEWNVVQFDG